MKNKMISLAILVIGLVCLYGSFTASDRIIQELSKGMLIVSVLLAMKPLRRTRTFGGERSDHTI
jgi:hypothetical protein